MTLTGLQSFLQSNTNILIPIYQRGYVWDKSKLEDLINDIENIDYTDPNSYHFYGLFVYTRSGTSVELIDGQQRITSILILLNTISDYFEWVNKTHYALSQTAKIPNNKINVANHIYNEIQNNNIRKIFTLNESNHEDVILSELVSPIDPDNARDYDKFLDEPLGYREEELKLKVQNKKIDGRTLRHKRTFLAHLFFKNHFNSYLDTHGIDKFVAYIRDISKKVLERLKVMDFEAATSSDAFKLFEVLNDRGISVSSVDLLKNVCLQNGQFQTQIDDIHDKWSEIMQRTIEKPEDFIFFLRSSHNSRFPFIRKSEIYSKFKERYSDLTYNDTISKLENELLVDAKNYVVLTGNQQIGIQQLDSLINILEISGTKQYIPLGMSALRVLHVSDSVSVIKRLVELFELTVETIVCMICNDIRFNKIEEELPEIARSIRSYTTQRECEDVLDSAIQKMKGLMAGNPSMSYTGLNFEDVDSGSTTGNNRPYKLLLLLLHYSTGMVISANFKELEHVLPQKATDAYWVARFDPSVVSDYTYSIGNMLLLDKKINASVSNKNFLLKKSEYKQFKVQDIVDDPGLRYQDISDWDGKVIKARESSIMSLLENRLGMIIN
jgi:uncharacterized protein with ParB-like and HNH nuclease domain